MPFHASSPNAAVISEKSRNPDARRPGSRALHREALKDPDLASLWNPDASIRATAL